MQNATLVSQLGRHLQRLRKERRLTLEQLSVKSGVSRSMLSQIERGQTNPTFGTLWNLSNALGLDMSELVENLETDVQANKALVHLSSANTPTINNAQSGCNLTILGPSTLVEEYEWYDLRIEPGCCLDSEPHNAGCTEHLTVLAGQARVVSGENALVLNTGDTARYRADIPHSIAAVGDGALHAMLVFVGASSRNA